MGAMDLPPEPEEPDRADHVRDRGADRPKAYDPDERGRAHEAMRAHVSAEAADEARPAEGGYWHEAPGFSTKRRITGSAGRRTGSRHRTVRPTRPGRFAATGAHT